MQISVNGKRPKSDEKLTFCLSKYVCFPPSITVSPSIKTVNLPNRLLLTLSVYQCVHQSTGEGKIEGGEVKIEGGKVKIEGGEGEIEGVKGKIEGGVSEIDGGEGKIGGGEGEIKGVKGIN